MTWSVWSSTPGLNSYGKFQPNLVPMPLVHLEAALRCPRL
jgi:hypothetical protein